MTDEATDLFFHVRQKRRKLSRVLANFAHVRSEWLGRYLLLQQLNLGLPLLVVLQKTQELIFQTLVVYRSLGIVSQNLFQPLKRHDFIYALLDFLGGGHSLRIRPADIRYQLLVLLLEMKAQLLLNRLENGVYLLDIRVLPVSEVLDQRALTLAGPLRLLFLFGGLRWSARLGGHKRVGLMLRDDLLDVVLLKGPVDHFVGAVLKNLLHGQHVVSFGKMSFNNAELAKKGVAGARGVSADKQRRLASMLWELALDFGNAVRLRQLLHPSCVTLTRRDRKRDRLREKDSISVLPKYLTEKENQKNFHKVHS